MTLEASPQQQQLIEISTDLVDWAPYMILFDFDGSQEVADPEAGDKPASYFRTKALDP